MNKLIITWSIFLLMDFSQDKTISVIENNSKVNNLIISEIDSGIYNAMNKGIIKSTGDIIVFLNSDDWFTEKNSIANVIKKIFL